MSSSLSNDLLFMIHQQKKRVVIIIMSQFIQQEHMRKKMEETGREFVWNDSDNAILMTEEQRNTAARAAVIGGDGVASGSDLYTSCIIAAESQERANMFAKLFEHNVESYSTQISPEQLAAIDKRICVGDACLACKKTGRIVGLAFVINSPQ